MTSKIVSEAWSARYKQDIETSLALLPKLKESKETIEALLLESSIARALGRDDVSNEKFKEVEKALDAFEQNQHFRFQLESGLRHFQKGEFWKALENFQNASHLAPPSSLEQQVALANSVLCLENLGSTYKNFHEKLETIANHKGIISELEALKIREMFRSGQISKIGQLATTSPQSIYLKKWISQLAYVNSSGKALESDAESSLPVTFFQRSYRLRTLEGLLHPEDFSENVKPSEWVSRLYLWTWRWLAQPETFSFRKVFELLKNFNWDKMLPRLSVEDREQLRNALMWIELFDENNKLSLKKWISLSSPVKDFSEVYRYEKLIIALVKARRDQDEELEVDLESQIHNEALNSEVNQLNLSAIANFSLKTPKSLETLVKAIKGFELIDSQEQPKNLSRIHVHMPHGNILYGKKNVMVSSILCRSLDLLFRKKEVSAQEFCKYVFAYNNYDSFIHDSKIYNVGSRLKNLAKAARSKFTLSLKEGIVRADFEANDISFLQRSRYSQDIVDLNEELLQSSSSNPINYSVRSHLPKELKEAYAKIPQKHFTRSELEEVFGKSRSSVGRLLKEWSEKGYIKAEGQARGLKYEFQITDKDILGVENP